MNNIESRKNQKGLNNIKEITEKLEQGVVEVFQGDNYKKYLEIMGRFHNYSFNNCILIAMQKPEATLVAGFKSWQTNFKRNVKKGEKAIKILAPIPHKFKKEIETENGEKEIKEIKYATFRAISVFDVSQTEGEELPTICEKLTGDVEGFKEIIKKLENVSPVPISYEAINGEANGYYSFITNSITVSSDLSEQQTVKTLIHEISHSILHNQETGAEKDADKSTKEIQAESVAYTVCSWLGLDTSDYSFGYVASWSENKEVKELQASMDIIRKTACKIIEGIERAA